MIYIKNQEQIDGIKKSCELLALLFNAIEESGIIEEGITTGEIDKFVEDFIVEHHGTPAFKGYNGFPAAACISLNDEVVHGIPGKRKVPANSLVKVDSGINLDGYISDAARTYIVGVVNSRTRELVEGTREAFYNGISPVKEGIHLSDISYNVEETAMKYNLGIVKELGGHGVGLRLHEDPFVPNYGRPGRGPVLKSGMVLAIEPMLTLGSGKVFTKKDGWTIATKDKSLSAHYENTILVLENGVKILTEMQ